MLSAGPVGPGLPAHPTAMLLCSSLMEPQFCSGGGWRSLDVMAGVLGHKPEGPTPVVASYGPRPAQGLTRKVLLRDKRRMLRRKPLPCVPLLHSGNWAPRVEWSEQLQPSSDHEEKSDRCKRQS